MSVSISVAEYQALYLSAIEARRQAAQLREWADAADRRAAAIEAAEIAAVAEIAACNHQFDELHMCQVSHNNGPVAARQKLDKMLAKLRKLCGVN